MINSFAQGHPATKRGSYDLTPSSVLFQRPSNLSPTDMIYVKVTGTAGKKIKMVINNNSCLNGTLPFI